MRIRNVSLINCKLLKYFSPKLKLLKEEMKNISSKKYFVVGSTINPGDCNKFKEQLPSKVKVLYNPEFISQGSIIHDLRTADMVLLGIEHYEHTDSILSNIRKLYEKIQTTRAIVCTMSPKIGRAHV